MWFPLLVVASAAILSGSAAYSAGKQNPKHPSVERPSKIGVCSFCIATIFYLISAFYLFQGHMAPAIGLGFAGLVTFTIGYGVTH